MKTFYLIIDFASRGWFVHRFVHHKIEGFLFSKAKDVTDS